jgi:hypothetical protein
VGVLNSRSFFLEVAEVTYTEVSEVFFYIITTGLAAFAFLIGLLLGWKSGG